MEKQDEPQVDGKRGGSHGPYAAYSGWDRLLAPTTNELQEKKKKRKKAKICLQASLKIII